MNPIIKLSDNAALRIKEIMANAEKDSIGVRVSVKSGGCAGMSYVMEYTKELNPNDEVIDLCLIILMKLSVVAAESPSKYHKLYYPINCISVLHYMHI